MKIREEAGIARAATAGPTCGEVRPVFSPSGAKFNQNNPGLIALEVCSRNFSGKREERGPWLERVEAVDTGNGHWTSERRGSIAPRTGDLRSSATIENSICILNETRGGPSEFNKPLVQRC
ncbi:hypothetical protein KM043_014505 [Ampulex compressa]|nr:hypothetical protein KM043_014505 [Ampulex compressa]